MSLTVRSNWLIMFRHCCWEKTQSLQLPNCTLCRSADTTPLLAAELLRVWFSLSLWLVQAPLKFYLMLLSWNDCTSEWQHTFPSIILGEWFVRQLRGCTPPGPALRAAVQCMATAVVSWPPSHSAATCINSENENCSRSQRRDVSTCHLLWSSCVEEVFFKIPKFYQIFIYPWTSRPAFLSWIW